VSGSAAAETSRRLTGSRLARLFVGLALLAALAGVAFWTGARTLVEVQSDHVLTAEGGGYQALNERVDARTFGALVAARSLVDAERGFEYSLRAPNGVTVAGNLDERAWAARPDADGRLRFELPNPASPGSGPRTMVGRVFPLADGSRLFAAYDLDLRVRHSTTLVASAIGGVVLSALFAALAAGLMARQTRRQMRDVSAAMSRILAGDLSQRLPISGRSSVDLLTSDFNVALARIERLTTTMRAVADSTAHDLRTPLNRLRAAVEVALRREDDPAELRAALDTVLIEVDRVQNTLEALLRIAVAESGTAAIEPVDLTAVVADVEELYKPLAEEKGLDFATRIDPGLKLEGNRQLLAQAVANLIDNAIKFTPDGGRVRLSATGTAEAIVLQVEDTGPGIPAADRERALERSRRLANASGKPGSGLGLSLVNAVARLHGGRFELTDNHPGLVARLKFARATPNGAPAPVAPARGVTAPSA
jgi:signal transduction histidine kinase